MGIKKKKNVIVLTIIVVVSFIVYQLYFFLAITSEGTNGGRVIHVLDHANLDAATHIKSHEDKNINENGVIRGVLYSNMPRFRPDVHNEFHCLKSLQRIPFEQVNDDYCDCVDSTDEPSTSACVDGVFFCDTQYQNKPTSLNAIPSSKVNDGICDCCDGSDEWLHASNTNLLTQGSHKLRRHYAAKCPNICYS